MKVVAKYPHAITAHMARQHLESAGIPAFVLDEHSHNVLRHRFGGAIFGGVKVAVAPEDAERAARILKTHVATPKRRCPNCESESNRRTGLPVYLALIVFAFSLGYFRPKHRCNDCSHEWRG